MRIFLGPLAHGASLEWKRRGTETESTNFLSDLHVIRTPNNFYLDCVYTNENIIYIHILQTYANVYTFRITYLLIIIYNHNENRYIHYNMKYRRNKQYRVSYNNIGSARGFPSHMKEKTRPCKPVMVHQLPGHHLGFPKSECFQEEVP